VVNLGIAGKEDVAAVASVVRIAPALAAATSQGQEGGVRGVDLHLSLEVDAAAVATGLAVTPTLTLTAVAVQRHEGLAVGVHVCDTRQADRTAITSVEAEAPALDGAGRLVQGYEGVVSCHHLGDAREIHGAAVTSERAVTPTLPGAATNRNKCQEIPVNLADLGEVHASALAPVGGGAPAESSSIHSIQCREAVVGGRHVRDPGEVQAGACASIVV